MKQVTSLQYGVIFKKAFCQLDVFIAFVKDILGIDLEIDRVETEKSFKPTIGKVDTRFDLFAEDKKIASLSTFNMTNSQTTTTGFYITIAWRCWNRLPTPKITRRSYECSPLWC